MSGTNGSVQQERIDDFDAIVAEHYGRVRINGKVYTIRPVNAVTQRMARDLRAQMTREDNPLDLTAGEFAARLAPRCLDPEPTPEEVDEMPTAVLEVVMERASRGLSAMERVTADVTGGSEKNEGAPATAPTPSPS